MYKQVSTVTQPSDIAVEVSNVTKINEQWQRAGGLHDIVHNLIKPQKKTIAALDDVSFQVQRGEFVAYAGPNGAGKSTTIKLLCGMLAPASGDIRLLGLSPLKYRIPLMKRVGILFGNRTELWWDHPVSTSFEWKRRVWDIPDDRFQVMRDMVVELLDIQPFLHTFARELSLGQRMRADLALMLLHEPEVILLDEPTLGLDVLAKRQMIRFLQQLNREKGTTIIVTSHDMDDLEEMARRILLLSQGKLAFDGNFTQLRQFIGCQRKVTVRFADGTQRIQDVEQEAIPALLNELSQAGNVVDIDFEQAPLEDALADLFQRWNQSTTAE